MGRPSDYSIELAEVICVRLAAGEGLVRVCREDGMPDLTSCYKWMRLHPEFLQMYMRAKEECADTLADEIMEIADSNPGQMSMGGTDRGGVDHLKLRVEARKWIAAKLKPKKYGDRIQQDVEVKINDALADRLAKAQQTAAPVPPPEST